MNLVVLLIAPFSTSDSQPQIHSQREDPDAVKELVDPSVHSQASCFPSLIFANRLRSLAMGI